MRRFLIAIALLASLTPGLALAQATGTPAGGSAPKAVTLVNPLERCPAGAGPDDPCRVTIPEFIGTLIRGFVGVIGALGLVVFIYGGFLLLTSRGDSAKIKAGTDAIKWAVIGIALVFSSYALVSFAITAIARRAG